MPPSSLVGFTRRPIRHLLYVIFLDSFFDFVVCERIVEKNRNFSVKIC